MVVAVALISVSGFFALFNKPQQAEAGWFDDAWLYRKSVAVTNNTTTETNVYIIATIDTSDTTRFQADCGDLRWTDCNGNILPHYIVSAPGCGDASTVVHIEFESFPAGAQTIYYYYGNPSAVNGFEASDFATVASDYTVGTIGEEEKGPGPVAYWSFDEGYGDTAYDETDNGNDGTRGGGTPAYKPTWQDESMCVSGKCLSFDGVDDYVDCGAGDSLDITEAITISAWVKPITTNPTGHNVIVSHLTGEARTYYLNIYNKDTLFLLNDGASDFECSPTEDVSLNVWTHIVGTYDGTDMKVYHNGVLKKTIDGPSSINSEPTNTILIGSYVGTDNFFKGSIDEVRIYPYARSAAQIKKDYNAGLAGMGGGSEGVGAALGGGGSQKWMTDGLVGYWKMDEPSWINDCSTEIVIDSSGAGNHGKSCPSGTGTQPATGKFGNGGVFDGDNDYVDCGNDSSLDITDEITIAAWVKINALPAAHSFVLVKGFAGQGDYSVYTKSDGITWFEMYTSIGKEKTPDYDLSSFVGQWIHYVGWWNSFVIKQYVNGIERTSAGTTGTVTAVTSDLFIGSRYSNDFPFNGSIDQVRIYNRALSPKEVRDLYNFAPGPVLHLKMDENAGTGSNAVKDTSGQERHGTMEASMTESDWVPGKYGSALDFDGTDDNISVGDFGY